MVISERYKKPQYSTGAPTTNQPVWTIHLLIRYKEQLPGSVVHRGVPDSLAFVLNKAGNFGVVSRARGEDDAV